MWVSFYPKAETDTYLTVCVCLLFFHLLPFSFFFFECRCYAEMDFLTVSVNNHDKESRKK